MSLDADGFSKTYPILISIAALFYLMIGLLYLNSLLRLYNINEFGRSLTMIAAVFGTNLFYYVVGEAGMSHIYSFAFFRCSFIIPNNIFYRYGIRILSYLQ